MTLPAALGEITISNDLRLADISEFIGPVSWDFGVGKVCQFSFPAVDIDGALSRAGLLRPGRTLTWEGSSWEVAAIERDYKGESVWLTFEARSRLARRLRNMTGPDKATDITPAQWITSKVKKAGGVAVVEPGAKRRTINQKRTESTLDVINALASETGTEWTEYGGTIYVGTPWWAFKGNPDLPTWDVDITGRVTTFGLEAATFNARESLDDRGNAAEATLTVAPDRGVRVRPWHRVDVTGASEPDNGLWLVTSSQFEDSKASDVSLSLSRPLKSSPKNGSTGTSTGTGSTADLPDLGPIKGSSYRDAQRPANWRGRSVSGMVSLFKANPNGLNHTIYRGCLWYAQEVAGYNHYGDHPKDLIDNVLGSRVVRSKTVVPGAVMLFTNSSIGHAVAYIGGGLCIGTDMDSSGRFVPSKWAIGPVDAMERSFGVTFYGWYAPP